LHNTEMNELNWWSGTSYIAEPDNTGAYEHVMDQKTSLSSLHNEMHPTESDCKWVIWLHLFHDIWACTTITSRTSQHRYLLRN